MLDLYHELQAIIGALDKRKIDYALCGGLAMAVYGAPRATIDIDLLVLPENLQDIRSLVAELGYNLDALPMNFEGGAIQIHRISKLDEKAGDLLSLDLILVTPKLSEVWENRHAVDWESGKISVVSPEGLITMKTLRKSGQDLDDIKKIEEALGGKSSQDN